MPGRLARLAGSIPQSFHNHSTIIPQSFHNHPSTISQPFHNHSTDYRIPGNPHSVIGWPAGWLAGGWLARPGLGLLAWPGWIGWLAGWPTPVGWLPVPGRLAGSIPQSFHHHSTMIPQSSHNHSTIIPQPSHNHSTDCRIRGNLHSAVGWPAGWLAAGWLARSGLGRLAWLGWLGLAGSLAGRPQLAGCPCVAGWLGWPNPFHNHSTTIPQSFRNHSTTLPQSFHSHATMIQQSFHNHSAIIPQSFHRLQNPWTSAFCGWLAGWLLHGHSG